MKKLFAILLAVAMVMGLALTASAAETTLPDLDVAAWWGGHTAGLEIDEAGVEVTFKSTTYADATDNWFGPLWVLYSADEPKVNAANYAEYWVERGDLAGWPGAAVGTGNTWDGTDLSTYGITHERTTEGDWDNFLANLKAGADCKLSAKRDGGNIVVVFNVDTAVSTVTIPFPADKTAYISLFAEKATLTNIVVKTPDVDVEDPGDNTNPDDNTDTDDTVIPDDTNPKDGDVISVVFAMMAVSAAGAAVLLKKKEN